MPTPQSHTLQLSYHNLLYTCHNIIHLPYPQYLIFCLQSLRHTFFAFICSTSLSNILLITELNAIDEIKINDVTNYIDFTKYLINNFIHERELHVPYIRSATILNTNTTTNRIPIHLMNLNATLIPK